MNVRDSSGVALSSYVFATDRGTLWNPGNTAIALVLNLEFAGWLVIVTTAIWLIGYALSFRWLDMFAAALHSFSDTLVRQIATPQMLLTAAAIGAFFVGWFIVRGYHAKAAIQVLTMLGVAILGPLFLASPLEDVLSSDGWLAQGRNVGISVAAGLNGENNPNPYQLVATMQEDLADNFARKPLQVWNFGHVIDDQVACASAWTAGAGSEDRVRKGMEDCKDSYAHWATEHPSVGQIGAGLLLLVSGIVLLAFAVVLAVKVIWAALDTIYHSIMAIFGFAAGGFIYGVTQTFLVRNLVDAFVASARMAIYTIFLGLYVLFLGSLFRQAGGQVMAVFVIGAIVEIIAILQLRRLSEGIDKGNNWIANRFALALHGPSGGGGGGGGTAIGMGGVGAKRTMGAGALTALGALATVGSSPLTEWVAGKTRSPLRPYARMEKKQLRNSLRYSSQPWHADANAQSIMKFVQFSRGAREAAEKWGGVNTYRGAAAAIQGLHDSGGTIDAAWGALTGAGFTDETLMHHAIVSWKRASDDAEDETLQYKHLGHVVSAMQHAQRSAHRLENGTGTAHEAAADLATLHESAWRFQRANDNFVTLDGGAATGPQRTFVRDYMNAPSKAKLDSLTALAASASPTGTGLLAGIQPADAQRMRNAIGNQHARNVQRSVDDLLENPTDRQNFRNARRDIGAALNTDMWVSDKAPTPWHSIAPPQSGARVGSYSSAMSAVNDLLNG
ncbi:hypothetical protein [Nocardia sp. NBC_00403]|uniref:hypothetical protein n=1 Tax=Nocardia sp. NBC_00403 TaxID=2975990 RepID=UPI002E1BF513